ncbi:MAG: hypothetical protein ACTSR2_00845 [Candidatus Hodarchaeales archaeon]
MNKKLEQIKKLMKENRNFRLKGRIYDVCDNHCQGFHGEYEIYYDKKLKRFMYKRAYDYHAILTKSILREATKEEIERTAKMMFGKELERFDEEEERDLLKFYEDEMKKLEEEVAVFEK